MCQKTLHMIHIPCTLRLVRCFQFQGMIWKTEHGSENSDFDFVSLLRSLRSFTWASWECFSPAQIWYRANHSFVNLLSFFPLFSYIFLFRLLCTFPVCFFLLYFFFSDNYLLLFSFSFFLLLLYSLFFYSSHIFCSSPMLSIDLLSMLLCYLLILFFL